MNPYECMYVVPKDRYMALVGKAPISHEASPVTSATAHFSNTSSPSSLCSVDGRDFKHPNILAHHMKEHVNGIKCNICGKVLKNASSLRKHLQRHRLQVAPPVEAAARAGPPGTKAGPPEDWDGPPAARAGPPAARARPPPPRAALPELRCGVCNKKMKHKRNLSRHMKSHKSSFQFKVSKWETLK